MIDASSYANFRLYLWTAGLAAFILLAGVVSMNYLVDPYFIHQWDTSLLKRLSPAQQRITPWSKTYAAYRYQPEVVFLGSSRTEIGLPTDTGVFSGKRVFNLGVRGGTLGEALSMLKHTSQFQRPEIVVWGLEYGWLFRDATGNTDFDRSNLVADNQYYPFWRTLINLKRSLTRDMTEDTLAILADKSEQSCLPLIAYHGNKPKECMEPIMSSDGGTAKAFVKATKKSDSPPVPADLSAVKVLEEAILDHCQAGTKFRLYIQPTHALDQLRFFDQWDKVEQWERALVATADRLKQQGCDVRLLDFSGFNRITTEEAPKATEKDEMSYYWETSHYRSEVGQVLLSKLMAPTPPAEEDNFGVELTSAVIEQHIQNVRKTRDLYCANHPVETGELLGKASNSL